MFVTIILHQQEKNGGTLTGEPVVYCKLRPDIWANAEYLMQNLRMVLQQCVTPPEKQRDMGD
jgi:hypothetical protein